MIAQASRAIIFKAEHLRSFTTVRASHPNGAPIDPRFWPLYREAVVGTEPIYVGTTPCEIISRAAAVLPARRLQPHDLITSAGFMCLAEGFWNGGDEAIDAIAYFPVRRSGSGVFLDPPHNGVWVCGILGAHDIVNVPWMYGRSLDEAMASTNNLDADDGYGPGRNAAEATLRMFMATTLFAKQKLLSATPVAGDRASRRLSERAGARDREALVITLRKRAASDAPPDPNAPPKDWDYQWLVRGHWRQQRVGEERAEVRPTWIAPYVKGPDDKPLRPNVARLFAVVR